MNMLLPNKILLLGIPIDRCPKEGIEEALERLIESYVNDNLPQFATTVTAIFLAKLSGFFLNHRVMPQVLSTLRLADFIGVDSKELQLLARLLGNEISIIRPEDLLLASASLLSKHKQSMFILGGNEGLCNKAKEALKVDFPGLKIAGVAAPNIYTKGAELNESIQTDDVILEMINGAKPAVLVLNMGHPKLEIWFERVRDRLKVPLVIGVGGALERYLSKKENEILSLPSWEKIKQKGLGFFRYIFWIPALLVYNTFNHFIYVFLFERLKKYPVKHPYLFLSSKESIYIAPFPPFVNRKTWDSQLNAMNEALEHENIVLDFQSVRHINPSGLGLMHGIWKKMRNKNKNLFYIGVNGDIQLLLKLNGAWDMFASSVAENAEEVLKRLSINSGDNLLTNRTFLSIDQGPNRTILSFFGRIDHYNIEQECGFQLEPILSGRSLSINLDHCTSINNLGFGFLLSLSEYQKRQNQSMTIENISHFVKKQFKYYQLEENFKFI